MNILRPFLRAKKIVLTSLLIGALSVAYLLFFIPSIEGKSPTPINSSIDSKELIYLTNLERVNNNLGNLSINPLLSKAAQYKAKDILENDYFSHNSPTGKKFSQWVKDVDYEYIIVGENLATGFSSNEAIMAAWMKSAKHRDNILHPKYKDIGIAVLKGRLEGQTTYIIVQYFGATGSLTISDILKNYSVYS